MLPCSGRTTLFYSDAYESQQQAKQLCAGCFVRELCLERALARPERFGTWGGTSARERDRMLRARAAVGAA